MADHSHNWYDETTTRERINDDLDNVNAIHECFKGEHLTKECSLKKQNETIVRENIRSRFCALPPYAFLGHFKEQIGSPYKTSETVHTIGNPKEIHNEKAQEDEGDMDVGWDITIHDKDKIVREKEQDYGIPLNDSLLTEINSSLATSGLKGWLNKLNANVIPTQSELGDKELAGRRR
ncbi:hypothetical protein Tco_0540349 [Tanacetum coccineum]